MATLTVYAPDEDKIMPVHQRLNKVEDPGIVLQNEPVDFRIMGGSLMVVIDICPPGMRAVRWGELTLSTEEAEVLAKKLLNYAAAQRKEA